MTRSFPGQPNVVDDLTPSPSGNAGRFGGRWRLVGAGLSNVWRFGDLELPAPTGRLLLRGPNGTGKTTALEALWPYLLDLNQTKLIAGKSRTTTLGSLMREGAASTRRYGYAWLTFAAPGDDGIWSFGVRLQYSQGASPQVRVVPFTVPGRPLHELALHGPNRAALMLEQFTAAVAAAGGEVFDDEDSYVAHVGARLWQCDPSQVPLLAARLRDVRNPTLLGEVSSRAAADALRACLPGVSEEVVTATAEALAESKATRDAFTRDRDNAEQLKDFADVWAGHVADVTKGLHRAADSAAKQEQTCRRLVLRLDAASGTAEQEHRVASEAHENLKNEKRTVDGRVAALQKSAGALAEIRRTVMAKQGKARSDVDALVTAAASIAERTVTLLRNLGELSSDLDEVVGAAGEVSSDAALITPLLQWNTSPRQVIAVAEATADPGPGVRVLAEDGAVNAAGEDWDRLANRFTERADAAKLALASHANVVAADKAASTAEYDARQAAGDAEAARNRAKDAARRASNTATALLEQISEWTTGNLDLVATGDGDDRWGAEDIADARANDPAGVLAVVDQWAEHVSNQAAMIAADLRSQALQAGADANRRANEAADLRSQAGELRGGRLLPLPRPDWSGAGDESTALGAALEWSPDFTDPYARALVESALTAGGVLGAEMSRGGVDGGCWRVTVTGPEHPDHLGAVVTVDSAHPMADIAGAVVRRIALADTAARSEGTAALVVGRDGTFRAGVLTGMAPGSLDAADLRPAQHVGARQRRAAALARAAELDAQADSLDAEAEDQRAEQRALEKRRTGVISRAATFAPSRKDLRDREAERANAATEARRAVQRADDLRAKAVELRAEHRRQHDEWRTSTRALNLPVNPDEIAELRVVSNNAARRLREAATRMRGPILRRLKGLLTDAERVDEGHEALHELAARARASHGQALEEAAALQERESAEGRSVQEALEEFAQVQALAAELDERLEESERRLQDTARGVATASEKLAHAQTELGNAVPEAQRRLCALREVLTKSDVAGVVLGDQEPTDDARLLAQLDGSLQGRRLFARRTVRERYDAVRAKVAGTWSLDPGESIGELDTFVLTHGDSTYGPVQAAARAEDLAERAQRALAAAEDEALRGFVLGRLPTAISTAWVRMHDWVRAINIKVRSATASSGVGVQVRTKVIDSLPSAARVVYELCCTSSEAKRSPAQRAELGQALQALIHAAPGDSMVERVAAAVDVRDWVTLHYEVTRPGSAKAERWGPRTGLSGGERRLVVLAPMLAAVAAAYDRFPETAPRLTALDEVPAEVDERGREGLARYLAELDLDLICTSYLWDGAPGAWDGIDAHDLESAADGTVVAFPMLVRGLDSLPDDIVT